MEVSITDINDVEKEIAINVSAEELGPHFEQAYKEYLPKIEIKGFRKGKAPLDLVKKIHGESIEYNSLDTVASNVYRRVIEERKIHPIGEPVLTDIHYQRGTNLSFKIKYEIKPSFELKEYKGISIEKIIHTVTEQEIEDEILRLRRANSTTTEVETAADDEHVITADAQELDESGSPLIGKKNANMKMYLADETLSPQIKEALKGVSAGGKRRAKVETNHEDHQHQHHFEFSVTKIEKVQLPEFSDDLVKKTTKEKVASVTDFRKQLRDDLEAYWKERSDRKLTDELIREIVNRHQITVPESLVKGVLDSLVEDIRNRYPNKKLPADFNEQSFREQNKGYASFQAKWYLIRERIIETEGFSVEDADIERLADTDASRMGIDKTRLVAFYKNSDAVKDRIVSEKMIQFLIAQSPKKLLKSFLTDSRNSLLLCHEKGMNEWTLKSISN
jgi:trigger factor